MLESRASARMHALFVDLLAEHPEHASRAAAGERIEFLPVGFSTDGQNLRVRFG